MQRILCLVVASCLLATSSAHPHHHDPETRAAMDDAKNQTCAASDEVKVEAHKCNMMYQKFVSPF